MFANIVDEANTSTYCLGNVLTEIPVHPSGALKNTVRVCREGVSYHVPADTIPVDLMLRSFGEEWKKNKNRLMI